MDKSMNDSIKAEQGWSLWPWPVGVIGETGAGVMGVGVGAGVGVDGGGGVRGSQSVDAGWCLPWINMMGFVVLREVLHDNYVRLFGLCLLSDCRGMSYRPGPELGLNWLWAW